MPDLLDTIRTDLASRLAALRPAAEEHAALAAALAALGGAPQPGRRAKPATATKSRGRRSRPAAGKPPEQAESVPEAPPAVANGRLPPVQPGSRPAQILELAAAEPGVAQSTVARRLKIDTVSLGYLVDGLEHAGHLERREQCVYRTAASLAASAASPEPAAPDR